MELLNWNFTALGIAFSITALLFGFFQYFNRQRRPKVLVFRRSLCWGISTSMLLYLLGLALWVEPSDDSSKLTQILTDVQQLKEGISKYETRFLDQHNNQLKNFDEVEVLEQKIVDARKGYMRIKVKSYYLNNNFDVPVTLQYEHGRYQPVLLTFTNDDKYGAGVVLASPEYEQRTVVYLNRCIEFEGFGKMTYVTDLIFKLYYNDCCVYFVPESGKVVFEYQLPPIDYGGLTCIGYFDENNEQRNRYGSEELPELEAFFQKYHTE